MALPFTRCFFHLKVDTKINLKRYMKQQKMFIFMFCPKVHDVYGVPHPNCAKVQSQRVI